jgi:hypothetical protein
MSKKYLSGEIYSTANAIVNRMNYNTAIQECVAEVVAK